MTDPKYAAFRALDPFFDIVQKGLAGLVDGDHHFDTIADNAVFEFRYDFPGWLRTVKWSGSAPFDRGHAANANSRGASALGRRRRTALLRSGGTG
jgi:hypothetical protein